MEVRELNPSCAPAPGPAPTRSLTPVSSRSDLLLPPVPHTRDVAARPLVPIHRSSSTHRSTLPPASWRPRWPLSPSTSVSPTIVKSPCARPASQCSNLDPGPRLLRCRRHPLPRSTSVSAPRQQCPSLSHTPDASDPRLKPPLVTTVAQVSHGIPLCIVIAGRPKMCVELVG
jgi:hypothetical protein